MTTFGQVRAIVQDVPSRDGWERLCALLDEAAHDEAAMQELLPYCEAHLASWPDALRVVKREVLERLLAGDPVPYWSQVRRLDLSRMKGLGSALPEIHERALFAHLTHLNVEYCRLAPEDLARLLHVPGMASLTRLDISYCGLEVEGAEVLAGAEHLEGLRELGLRRNKLKSKGGTALVGSKVFANLTYLDIGYNMLGKKAAGALFGHATFSDELDYLDLCYGKLGARAARDLVGSDVITKVRSLNLRECGMESDGLRELIARDDLTRLRELGLCSNDVRDAILELGAASWFGQLEFLDASSIYRIEDELRHVITQHASADLKVFHYRFDGIEPEMLPWRS